MQGNEIYIQNRSLFLLEQSAFVSTIEVVQCNQPATMKLADQSGKWCHIGGSALVSAAGKLGTPVVAVSMSALVTIAELMHDLPLCHHSHFFHELIEQ